MKSRPALWTAFLAGFATLCSFAATPTARNTVSVSLPPPSAPAALLPESPFGINTAFDPDTPDLVARLQAMQHAGIKWGRQDFTWRQTPLWNTALPQDWIRWIALRDMPQTGEAIILWARDDLFLDSASKSIP